MGVIKSDVSLLVKDVYEALKLAKLLRKKFNEKLQLKNNTIVNQEIYNKINKEFSLVKKN